LLAQLRRFCNACELLLARRVDSGSNHVSACTWITQLRWQVADVCTASDEQRHKRREQKPAGALLGGDPSNDLPFSRRAARANAAVCGERTGGPSAETAG
jgi:hypothetical protein